MLKTVAVPFALLEGNIFHQVAGAVILAIPASIVGWFLSLIELNVLADTRFAESLMLLLIIDLVTGIWKHLKKKDFCWKRMYTGFLQKLVISFLGMTAFNVLGNVRELSELEGLRAYLILCGKLVNVFYVGGSAFNNMFIITGGKFPPVGWMERMKNFNRTADISALNKPHESNDTDNNPRAM